MEANEKQQNNSFTRNHYYPGKLLHADDFINEQKYYNGKQQFINRKFHGCGIIDGLEVQVDGQGRLELGAGSALDGQGRIIVVSAGRILEVSDIEGLKPSGEQDFVLGISYAEKEAGQERYFLDKEETYHAARIIETYTLRAFRMEEWRHEKHTLPDRSDSLTQRNILYENEIVRLILEMPGLVPSDSIFRIRVQAESLSGKEDGIGWHIAVSLQGGYFLESGSSHQILASRETEPESNWQQEWDIFTDEKRHLPIVLDINELKIWQDGYKQIPVENFQFYIDTSEDYHRAAKDLGIFSHNQEGVHGAAVRDWIPLAHLRMVQRQEGNFSFQTVNDKGIRLYIRNLWEEEMLRKVMGEKGIVDIRWRNLIKAMGPGSYRGKHLADPNPEPPVDPIPLPQYGKKGAQDIPGIPGPGGPEDIRLWNWQKERLKELLEADRKERVRRGLAIISIPKRYRHGQVLYSEEISHGFPGEEVLLWCGRVWEERNYAYWNREKSKYSVTHGVEDLFPKLHRSGWGIEEQAIHQDVDKGTFQIALTLLKGRRRNREKEVAISWVACRIM